MSGRSALVIGLGRSGAACARVLDAEGWRVVVSDRGHSEASQMLARTLPAGVELLLDDDGLRAVESADMICPSPGVDWRNPALERARRRGLPIRSEIALAFERCPAPIAGVTGTNGKTTTTALLGSVLEAGGARVHVGGNIGETILDRLDTVQADDWVVLELSSFQLESVGQPRCRLATVLNISADHLDRHGSVDAYAAAKRRLVTAADPRGAIALNACDSRVRAMADVASAPVTWFGRDFDAVVASQPNSTVRDGWVVLAAPGRHTRVLPVADIPLFGAHNVDNVLAATALGDAAGVAAEQIADAVRGFRPVPHRLQPVLDAGGVLWVNDSKATNVDAATTALRSFDRPIVWIGGGGYKGVGPEQLAASVARHARYAVLNGASGREVDAALGKLHYDDRTLVADLRAAVLAAQQVARPGDVVLLAPGYTSFDQFSCFEERGDAFAALVCELVGEGTR
jgi:UDP-N-acetylmuramoylalanine--D-glutamate ligase